MQSSMSSLRLPHIIATRNLSWQSCVPFRFLRPPLLPFLFPLPSCFDIIYMLGTMLLLSLSTCGFAATIRQRDVTPAAFASTPFDYIVIGDYPPAPKYQVHHLTSTTGRGTAGVAIASR